ncbi:MAG TPA: SufD family Fe-S cluster assembly protein [Candidatus Limnocylindrales bacterium]|nr:SufD family Fe-S cluster assembly protein [Candidatus Limnocylindrales bacterium]
MTERIDLPGLGFATEDLVRSLSRDLEEPDWLLEQRLAALARYAESPIERNRLWTTYVDLRPVRFAEIEPWGGVDSVAAPTADPPPGAAALLHVRDDAVVERALSAEARDAGVFLGTFSEVLRERPDLAGELLAGESPLPADDKFGQLTVALHALGVVVHVPQGVSLAAPIVLRWSVGAAGRGLFARTLVSLGRDAHARILEEQAEAAPADGAQRLYAGTTEVRLGDGATLDLAAEQDFGPGTVSFLNRAASVGRDATLRWALASVGGDLVKSRIDNDLVGRGASVQQVEIGFGGGSQLFDLSSYTRHLAPDTTGDLLSKGVFQDRARGYMKGLIAIDRLATGTDSFLGEFGMLLSRKARSVTIPSLEIDQPDVRRAAHSSSVGPIDEGQVFYAMSRGLPRDVARKHIVLGFLEPVVARIPLPEAQERLRALLDRKWDAGREAGPAASAA